MTTVQIFGFAGSTYVRSAMICCHALDLDWKLTPLEFGQASHLSLHPFGKMPVMKHGEVRLYETAAILSYLNDLSEKAPLIPDNSIERAQMWQLISICVDYGYPALVKASFADDPTKIDTQPALIVLDVINGVVGSGQHLVGQQLCLADLVFEPMLTHYLSAVPGAQNQLQDRPGVLRWHKTMQERPAVVSAYKESQAE